MWKNTFDAILEQFKYNRKDWKATENLLEGKKNKRFRVSMATS